MLPPIEMLAKKNRLPTWALMSFLLGLFAAGCAPSGANALLDGRKRLESGDYAGAVAEFQSATALLPNNAAAWNYLGVACQKAGDPANAAAAYQRALALDRDLVETHWNLGMLSLEQGRNDQAAAEFTTYTLRRPNATDGWLKLGAAQLRLGQFAQAEASFGWVEHLDPNNAEAWNGLGLARIERNRPRDALQFFAAVLQKHPGDPTATLNLAITEQTYLHDDRAALQYYAAYLALTPRPANYDDVNAEAASLEQNIAAAASATPNPPPMVARQNPPPQPQPQPVRTEENSAAPVVASTPPPTTPMARFTPNTPVITHNVPATKPQVAARTSPPPPENHPAPKTTGPVTKPPPHPQVQTQLVATVPPPSTAPPNPAPAPANPSAPAAAPGFWDKMKPNHWFASGSDGGKNEGIGMTALPPAPASTEHPVSLASFPRYHYLSPARPTGGDHRAASGSFTSARIAEQASRFVDAMQQYRSAAEYDPGWFEAQYDYAVLAQRLGSLHEALGAYEMALAIDPGSVSTRYSFALALKAAGYVPDAINELKKVLAAHPAEPSVHLALANLYAQKLHDAAKAREHYLKVLALDPGNSEAPDIRAWLSANPG